MSAWPVIYPQYSARHASADAGFYDDNAMLVRIHAGAIGGQPGGGVISTQDVGLTGLDDAFIAYDLIFAPNYPFASADKPDSVIETARGGKLHGFQNILPGVEFHPGSAPDGANGFRALLMWGSDATGANDRLGSAYLYAHDMKVTGQEYGRGPAPTPSVFRAGESHKVEMRCKLNTPGQDDGLVQAWVNGVLVAEMTDFMARNNDSLRHGLCSRHLFFGGGNQTWASWTDTWALSSNLRSSRSRIGDRV